jgi:pectinesterase
MKMPVKLALSAVLGAAVLAGLPGIADEAPLPRVRIALVGDSTVTSQGGWGDGFSARLSDRAEVTNLAASGRSSMSFVNEGKWKRCLEQKPDYVLIQFGHNDQKIDDPKRGTDPQTTYREHMTRYVTEARAAGIKPVLVTSLSRRAWGKDGKIHSTLGPYVDVVRAIAKEKDVPLIELNARSIELYERLGKAETDTLSPRSPDPSEKGKTLIDGTHLNAKGGTVIGKLVAEEMARAVPGLARYVKAAEAP